MLPGLVVDLLTTSISSSGTDVVAVNGGGVERLFDVAADDVASFVDFFAPVSLAFRIFSL